MQRADNTKKKTAILVALIFDNSPIQIAVFVKKRTYARNCQQTLLATAISMGISNKICQKYENSAFLPTR